MSSEYTVQDLESLLTSSQGILCDFFDDPKLPEICQDAFQYCARDPATSCDRWLIYTDGSSAGPDRHAIPDQPGNPNAVLDAWAFLVVGETYVPLPGQACFSLIGWSAQPIHYDETRSHFLGADRLGADVAEREGLFWAALWRLGQNSSMPTVFRPDSLTTGHQAFGAAGAQQHTTSFRALRGVFQALQSLLPDDLLRLEHVVSHTDDPFNAFVDHAAKEERASSYYLQRQPIDMKKLTPMLPFLWMYLDRQSGLPQLTQHGFDAHAPDLPPSTSPALVEHCDPSGSQTSTTQARFALAFASANVASLCHRPDGHSGRLDYLRQQFKAHGLHFVGIQEARTEACSSKVDSVYRIASGHAKGHYGVELWINLAQPFIWTDDQPFFFETSNFVAVHLDPRCLIVRLDHPHLQAFLVVAHAPQSGQAEVDRAEWWGLFQGLLSRHCLHHPCFVMLDANATTGPFDDVHVFQNDDASSVNTDFLRDLLCQQDLCLPSTDLIHSGSNATWTSPDGSFAKRIDYVAVPVHWKTRCTFSQVLEHFDFVKLYDHAAVGLELRWHDSLSLSYESTAKPRLPGYDRTAVRTTEMHSLIASQQVPSWSTDIEAHVAQHQQQTLEVLATCCPPRRNKCKKVYMTSDIWQLRTAKLQAKKQVQAANRSYKQQLLQACFSSWHAHHEQTTEHMPPDITHCDVLCDRLRSTAALVTLDKKLRCRITAAKQLSLQQALGALDTRASATDILQQVKQHYGPTNPKKCGKRPAPILDNEDGTPCLDAQASLDRWINFFKDMEGGERMSAEELRTGWIDNLRRLSNAHFDINLTALPSLLDLETALRRIANNKATGPDHIPGEFCNSNPAAVGRQMYSQLLKLILHGHEALCHKHGRLTTLWKGKGPHREASSYRSILISSHVGKALHRTLRVHQSDLYEAFLQAQQVGGRRKVPVTIGLHMVRSFIRWQKQQQRSSSVIFLDLKEAFYRIVRPLVVDTPMTDEALASMAARLRLPDNTLHELHALLCQDNAAQMAHLPWHARKYLTALHTDTNFSFAGQQDVCRTTIGTRPGDAFADVVFGYAWARVLASLEQAMSDHQLTEMIPSRADFHPYEDQATETGSVPFLGPSWMDDLAVCLSASTAVALESKTALVTGLLLDLCHQHGMTPNVQKGKTEILFSFRGKGSRKLRLRYHSEAHGKTLPVICGNGVVDVSVIGEYLHLGATCHHSTQTSSELKRRIAIGHQAAFTKHRKLLYHNKAIPFDKRRQFFETLVLSKILYGTEIWTLDTKETVSYFHNAILRLYRRLLRVPHDSHMADHEILADTGLPSPADLLKRQRLRYLVTLCQCSQLVPWGLFHADAQWHDLLRQDLDWMYAHYAGPLLCQTHVSPFGNGSNCSMNTLGIGRGSRPELPLIAAISDPGSFLSSFCTGMPSRP